MFLEIFECKSFSSAAEWRATFSDTSDSHIAIVVLECFVRAKIVRGVGFEPTNPYRIGASGLRL